MHKGIEVHLVNMVTVDTRDVRERPETMDHKANMEMMDFPA